MNTKVISGQILLALMLAALLATGCTLGEKKKEEKNEQKSVSQEKINEDNLGEENTEELEENKNENSKNKAKESENIAENNENEVVNETAWKLVSGDPSDTCSSPTYKGEAQIRGFYVYDYSYVEKEWLLQILPEDANKIPVNQVYSDKNYSEWIKKPQFALGGVTPELEKELKSASKDNPKTITVKGFKAYCEGVPQLSINGF